jgi:hypothetical protein
MLEFPGQKEKVTIWVPAACGDPFGRFLRTPPVAVFSRSSRPLNELRFHSKPCLGCLNNISDVFMPFWDRIEVLFEDPIFDHAWVHGRPHGIPACLGWTLLPDTSDAISGPNGAPLLY